MNNNEVKLININDTPKLVKLIMAFLPIIGAILISNNLDNDFYFLYPTGEYIVNNGFPTKDFLSMHSNMDIIVQQWLSDVLFYYVYKYLGKIGILSIIYIIYALFAFVMYKLCKLVSDNHFISCMVTFVGTTMMAPMFFKSRPQIFTYLIMLLELYLLEQFVKTNKTKWLIGLPILSLLLINMHSSMWAMLFVFMAPYFAGAIPINLKRIKQTPCCSFVKLTIFAVISLVMGFINPYGTKAMLYILTSFGYEEVSKYISEMAPITLSAATGYLVFVLVVGFLVLMQIKKGKLTTRFVLLYVGTLILALNTQKSIAYFVIAGFPAMAYGMSDFSFNLKVTPNTNNSKEKTKRAALIGLLVILIAVAGVLLVNSPNQEQSNANKVTFNSKQSYAELDRIIDILDENCDNDIVLYAGFNNGQYLEFYGYHPYIDGRAELFLDDNNHEYNYMKEAYDLKTGELYYKDFVDKYQFNYLIVGHNEIILYNSMLNDDDYTLLYNGDGVALFELKK